MKKSAFLLIAIFAMLFATPSMAQWGSAFSRGSLWEQTRYNPPTYRQEPVTVATSNGTFTGTKHTTVQNGQITDLYYRGTITQYDGTRIICNSYMTKFNQYFNMIDGCFFEIKPNGEVYKMSYLNGYMQNKEKFSGTYRISNNLFEVIAEVPTTYGGGGYSGGTGGGYSNGGGTNGGGGSNYNSHTATCRGCNGSGSCQHCRGTGKRDSSHNCSLCHGTGRCQSCAGTGKIHGNF